MHDNMIEVFRLYPHLMNIYVKLFALLKEPFDKLFTKLIQEH